MTTQALKDGNSVIFYIQGTGTGADGSHPFIPFHLISDGTNTAAITAGSALKVDNSAVTQPVSGTFWQATQPVSLAGTVSLVANQSMNVAQINGITPLMGNGVTGTGSQRVTIASDNTPFGVLATLQSNTGVDIGKLTANQSVNSAQINGVTPLMGNGVTGTGSQRVTIASDNTAFSVNATLQANSGVDIGKLTANQSVNVSQINAVTPLMGNGVTGTGSQRVTIASDNTAFSVNATTTPATSGGLTIYKSISVVATGQSVKASAGQLYGAILCNAANANRFVKFYNKASAATVGTDTPVFTVMLPAGSAMTFNYDNGIAFATGISIGATNLVADADTTAPSANDVVVSLFYK